jgi:hypothetical protein
LRKHLLLILGLFVFFLHLVEETKPAQNNYTIPTFKRFTLNDVLSNESIVEFVQDSLLKPPYKSAYIDVKWGPLHPRILGLTTKVKDGIFFIQLSRGISLEETQKVLMHELIHVYQFHYNLLEDLPNGNVRWKDSVYTWSMAWKDRPWEIHAEAWSTKLFKTDSLYLEN